MEKNINDLLERADMTVPELEAILTDIASVDFGKVTVHRNSGKVTTVVTERSRLLNQPKYWKLNAKPKR